ncbi:isoleucine--tRNA ligase [Candidatus Woesearchaeota archaeon]|nr:isoleucine--tRNA ligase [Candidatus Woesearchaeota archaeon]
MYDPIKIESDVFKFWEKNKIYYKAKEKNKGNTKFYYLDGPPYTTGTIHIGHAWGKALRDSVLRYKRMKGFDAYDQAGFDMHGLPIEHKVEEKLGLKSKADIVSFGVQRFIKECEKFAIEQMHPMITDFKRIGIWLDFDNPYMTIKNSYIEGAWWALKKADENKLLYEGLKSMTWCSRCATALAKHELVYDEITDDSIFVKLNLKNKNNEYLIIWTTTPWTLNFNLAVMVNPNIDYLKIKVENEKWIIAKALAGIFVNGLLGKQFEIMEEFKGESLEGLKYEAPFEFEPDDLKDNKNIHSVILSAEYVDVSGGSGLVHCAPGCGPEDYEAGKKYGLPAYNTVDENGRFTKGKFAGLMAKKDDKIFIEALGDKVIAKTEISHEYAHCWRCNHPVIYRATRQWFLAVEKIKDKLIESNKKIKWQPEWGGSRWFNSWLNDLQDWCISRQRFWGIPLPIWVCNKCDNYAVIGTKEELKRLANDVPEDLHKPWIDFVKIECKCGGQMSRVDDVLDVWLDSGAAPWACLNFPSDKELFKKWWPMDFILEGKDQIRGWFNSLICLSMASHKEPSYKAVYMHGMILDSRGRKMSKSLGNVISPYEVIEKYGVDAMRFYMITGASPGLDLNYNFDDVKQKQRTLMILLNIHNYLLENCSLIKFNPEEFTEDKKYDVEDRYIVSRLNSTIKEVTEMYEDYRINEPGNAIEGLILDLSRIYMQLTRDKINSDNLEERRNALHIIYKNLLNIIKLLAPITPYHSEHIYQGIKGQFNNKKESIHLYEWPKYDKDYINKNVEDGMALAFNVIREALYKRETAKINIRWPLSMLSVISNKEECYKSLNNLKDIIKKQANVKEVEIKLDETLKEDMQIELDMILTSKLEQEGYAREITRRIQDLRKKIGLKKENRINLFIKSDYDFGMHIEEIKKKANVNKLIFAEGGNNNAKEKIKEKEFFIGIDVVTT